MQLMCSSVITQSRLKTSLVDTFFFDTSFNLGRFVFFFPPSSGSAEDTEQPAPSRFCANIQCISRQ